jgi:hypothetical protein
VSVVLAVALLPVVLYCSVRALWTGRDGRETGDGHHRDVDAWHAVLGAAMVAMVLGRLTGSLAVVVLALAGVVLTWGVLSVERAGAAAYARLAVTGAATGLMAWSLVDQAAVARTGHAGAGLAGSSWGPVLAVLVAALAVVAVSASRVVVRRGVTAVGRVEGCCDVVMAAVMVLMLLGLS